MISSTHSYIMMSGTLTAATQSGAQHNTRPQKPSVLVVGAGLIGSSVAMHLAQKGCPVVVVEAAGQPAAELNQASMKLWQQCPDLAAFPGTLLLGDERPERNEYPSAPLTAEQLKQEEPALSANACKAGARLYKQEGYAYPETAVNHFLKEAQHHGASVLFDTPVQSLAKTNSGKKVSGVVTPKDTLHADVIVLAAALGIPELTEPLGLSVPLTAKPRTVTVITKPLKPVLKHIVVNDTIFIVQRRDGDVMISVFAGDERPEGATDAVARQVIEAAAQYVPELSGAECQQVTAGLMPYPVDAHPIVGYSKDWPNLYVAVMHSGATLAPLIGELVSQEIIDKQDADLLKPYRLQRDFSDLDHIY